jgi:hypothetical protein
MLIEICFWKRNISFLSTELFDVNWKLLVKEEYLFLSTELFDAAFIVLDVKRDSCVFNMSFFF